MLNKFHIMLCRFLFLHGAIGVTENKFKDVWVVLNEGKE